MNATDSPSQATLRSGPILNISAYKFVRLEGIEERRAHLLQTCQELGLRGTILLSSEGINLFLAGAPQAIGEFLSVLRADSALADLQTKDSFSDTQPFRRMLVRLKKEIIAFGVEGVAPEKRTSPKLSPRQLQQWLDEGRPVRLLDTRNIYEYDLGTFHGAEQLHIDHFREFPDAIAQLPEEAKRQPLVMFCTGGIRCEKAGPMMEQAGFEEVYQLDGGILKYFEECGGQHYHGSCFVFDGRVALDSDLQPTGHVLCFACQAVLSPAEVASDKFLLGQCCPRCFQEPAERQLAQRQQRETAIRELATQQPGCSPYENLRKIFVPRRFAQLMLIDFLDAWHPPTPRAQWAEWIEAGQFTHRGQIVSAEWIVKEGECFEQRMPGTIEPPINPDIRLLYEDDYLVVVNKPAPLPIHPSGRYNRNTLSALMASFYPKQKLRLAHRLDAQTSGVVVLCRTQHAARLVQPQFARGEVAKVYWARVHGHPTWETTECQATISPQPHRHGSRLVDTPDGLQACTQFRVLQRCHDGTSLIEAAPLTGRTHQIRLHLCHLGHAIVGDPLYGSQPQASLDARCSSAGEGTMEVDAGSAALEPSGVRMCLHSARISLVHPIDGARQTYASLAPEWFSQ